MKHILLTATLLLSGCVTASSVQVPASRFPDRPTAEKSVELTQEWASRAFKVWTLWTWRTFFPPFTYARARIKRVNSLFLTNVEGEPKGPHRSTRSTRLTVAIPNFENWLSRGAKRRLKEAQRKEVERPDWPRDWSEPQRAVTMSTGPTVGWVWSVEINAKNSFGGYVGFRTFHCMICEDGVFRTWDVEQWSREPWGSLYALPKLLRADQVIEEGQGTPAVNRQA